MSPAEHPRDAQAQIRYSKLPGGFRGFFRRYSLWIGGDHLLFVDSTRFSEIYKRFYLRDIQTIMIRKTPRFVLPYYWNVLLGLLGLLVGLSPFRAVLFWPSALSLAGIAIYLYVVSMFQSCTCHLVTRVNKVELPSLFRLRSAEECAKLVAPRILAVQGELPADWVDRSTTLEERSTAADRNPDVPVDLLPAGQFSWTTVAVFAFVLIDAGLTWVQLSTKDPRTLSTTNVANTMNMIALAVCATIAIVRLSRQKDVRALRMLVLGGLIVVAAATYGATLLQSLDQQVYRHALGNPLRGMRLIAIAEIVADVAIVMPGFVLAFRQMQGGPTP